MVFPNKWEGKMGSIAEDCRFDGDSVFSCLMLAYYGSPCFLDIYRSLGDLNDITEATSLFIG